MNEYSILDLYVNEELYNLIYSKAWNIIQI